MSPALEVLEHHVAKNLPEYITFVGALAIATVVTMPEKCPLLRADHPLQEVWAWIRNALQTAIPAARPHPQNPQQPAGPAQQLKEGKL